MRWGANGNFTPLAAIFSDVMSCLDHYFLSTSNSLFCTTRSRVHPMKRACPSGGDTQRRGRQQVPPIETHNKAAICREKYAARFSYCIAQDEYGSKGSLL
jgi:hypothetical protein